MKLELKENMYVRTEEGKIFKTDGDLIYLNNDKTILYKLITRIPYDTISYKVIKASYNIIDILEVGDVIEIDVIDEDNYPTIMGINFARIDNKVELASIKDMLKNESAKLLEVTTHEQMEQRAYKVEE